MGSGGIQAKADYIKPVPTPVTVPSTCTVSLDLLQRMIAGDQAATLECLALMGTHKLESIAPKHPTPLMSE